MQFSSGNFYIRRNGHCFREIFPGKFYFTTAVRKNSVQNLELQKSVMDSMRVPVTLLSTNDRLILFKRSTGNETVTDGFAIVLLNVMKEALRITTDIVISNDTGYYGLVTSDKKGKGIVGLYLLYFVGSS